MTKDEALKLALSALDEVRQETFRLMRNGETLHAEKKVWEAIYTIKKVLAQPKQEPVAYDKTEMNCFVQDLYDKKMQEGKHGHYETMFHVVHQAIKKVTPQRTWVGPMGISDKRLMEMPSQPEQEPIGYVSEGAAERLTTVKQAHEQIRSFRLFTHDVPLYTTPPQSTWVGPEQEPVAWGVFEGNLHDMFFTEAEAVELAQLKGNHAEVKPLYTAPQRTWVGLDWLPKHRCGLHLSHNEHRDVYETVEKFYDVDSFISMEELTKAISEDSVWVLHWYPETPIGFHRIAASTLEAIEAKLKEKNHD